MGLSAQQIVARACQRARVPGYTQQAGQYLNAILADLCQSYDFDFARHKLTLNIGPAAANYPLTVANPAVLYLRTREVFYSVNGTIFWLTPFAQGVADFDMQFQGSGISNYPEKYATQLELTPPQMLFYPPPNQPLAVTVRYQPLLGDIGSGAWTAGGFTDDQPPENSLLVPWFPNQRYLLTQLSAELMDDANDPRVDKTLKRAEDILRGFLAMDDDKEGRARNVPLDPNRFRTPGRLRLTKDQPLP